MPAKKKRGGRVTPKGTQNPSKKPQSNDSPVEQKLPRHVPRRDAVEKGRASRPITHHRGNR